MRLRLNSAQLGLELGLGLSLAKDIGVSVRSISVYSVLPDQIFFVDHASPCHLFSYVSPHIYKL